MWVFKLDRSMDNNEFLSFCVLKLKYHLSVATSWQYLQLQHLLTFQFGAAFSASKTPNLLQRIIKSYEAKKPQLVFINIY